MEFAINNFFEKSECSEMIEFMDLNGTPFSYFPKETWDCKRLYNDEFKEKILNKIKTLYATDKFKLWFDLNEFQINDINISLTKYYDGKWLDLHLDSTSQFTTVIVLSENFNDGRFALSNRYGDINKCEHYGLEMGQSISFDGSKIYHGVLPVTVGTRCAMNIWMTNTDFKYRPIKKNKSII